MKTAIAVGGATHANIRGMVEFVQQAERLGVNYVWSAEAWSQDAVTSLAYLAGQTSRIMLGTGIIQISARTPSMTAMTALALHDLSEGRFVLGLGTSGPLWKSDYVLLDTRLLARPVSGATGSWLPVPCGCTGELAASGTPISLGADRS